MKMKKPDGIDIVEIANDITSVQDYIEVCTLVDQYAFLLDVKDIRKSIDASLPIVDRNTAVAYLSFGKSFNFENFKEYCKQLALKYSRSPFFADIIFASILFGNVRKDDLIRCSYVVYDPNGLHKIPYSEQVLAIMVSPTSSTSEILSFIKTSVPERESLQESINKGRFSRNSLEVNKDFRKFGPSHGKSLATIKKHRSLYWEHKKGIHGFGYNALADKYACNNVETIRGGINSYTALLNAYTL